MESFTITVTEKTSELKSVFFPPIDLDGNYEIGVVDFQSYNSIYNVITPDNVLYYNEQHVIYIPNNVYKFDELTELDGLKNKVEFSVENDVIKIKSLDLNMELIKAESRDIEIQTIFHFPTSWKLGIAHAARAPSVTTRKIPTFELF